MRSVIFDFDGTLLDSMQIWTEIDRAFLLENGIEPPEGISDIVKKMSIEESSAYFVERFSLPMTPEAVSRRIEEMADAAYRYDLQLKEGAGELLEGLWQRGIPCCIVSVTYPSLLEAAIQRLKIGSYVSFYLTPASAAEGKHTPALYQAAAKRLGTDIADTVVVEDALYAARTAKNAGFYTVGVLDPVGKPDWDAMRALCDRTTESLCTLCDASFYSIFH
ncbi:MAG: HAD family phosphatase [Oscillospiraceae bacterium]|nr:HAD family phosphatase [Oscillospiraceae bacterium]